MGKIDYKKQGKKNKAAGKAFEDRVYLELERKGTTVSRWMKNVELQKENSEDVCGIPNKDGFIYGKLIPAKPKIRMIPGKGPMLVSTWTGFPDFVVLKKAGLRDNNRYTYDVFGVECKINGTLDKAEKEKIEWLLSNNIFSKVLIAMKDKNKRGGIIYIEYEKN